jgi:predicted patatin/cPLA2 family phospholipase
MSDIEVIKDMIENTIITPRQKEALETILEEYEDLHTDYDNLEDDYRELEDEIEDLNR